MIKINKEFRCKFVYSELNQVIQNIWEIIDKAEVTEIYSKKYLYFGYDLHYESLIEILFNIPYEKINLMYWIIKNFHLKNLKKKN